ncbi:hypothetical protein THAOC_17347 [Thalassiosira oceanica]|uniref:Uncharacterized protein n=1 Tax=Thalassiosira oceanica TaxID=159749 RepID=K0S7E5_THAOC|nr:hypothetical protein THAOC_17347 [Thalassiosira oceanica]|eukprot:EJK62058.1 hypothetical protein THAOC_17347 [Thalassiosira oceanica]
MIRGNRGAKKKRKRSKDVGGGATASGPSTSALRASFGRVCGGGQGGRKQQRRRSSHLEDTSTKVHLMESDEALRNELSRLESSGSKPEDPEDIPAMFDSYLNLKCLYYSLVGVLAIETSLFFPNRARFAPFANGS